MSDVCSNFGKHSSASIKVAGGILMKKDLSKLKLNNLVQIKEND